MGHRSPYARRVAQALIDGTGFARVTIVRASDETTLDAVLVDEAGAQQEQRRLTFDEAIDVAELLEEILSVRPLGGVA